MYTVRDADGNEVTIGHLMPEQAERMLSDGWEIIRDGAAVTDPAEVAETEPSEDVLLVAPEYVDDRMIAVVDVFDAMAAEVGGGSTMSTRSAPASSFAEALERLREIVSRGASINHAD